MDFTVKITQELHDCMLGQLRKIENDDGTFSDDLTVQQWTQAALDGKANKCFNRLHPKNAVAAAEAVSDGLARENAELKSRVAALEIKAAR
jgi:hypothetical protein